MCLPAYLFACLVRYFCNTLITGQLTKILYLPVSTYLSTFAPTLLVISYILTSIYKTWLCIFLATYLYLVTYLLIYHLPTFDLI